MATKRPRGSCRGILSPAVLANQAGAFGLRPFPCSWPRFSLLFARPSLCAPSALRGTSASATMAIKAPVGSGSPSSPAGVFLMYALGVCGGVYIRQRSRARSWLGSFVFLYIHPTPQDADLRQAAGWALEAILGPFRGGTMHDPANELRRIPLLGNSVNRGTTPVQWV